MSHVFLTGHTGFKGTWLLHLLKLRNVEISGYSLPELKGSLFDRTRAREFLKSETIADIRDTSRLNQSVLKSGADTIIHLAAQPLVLEGYLNPRETFEVNFSGTLNVIEAAIAAEIDNILVITTDKVYRDTGLPQAYKESAHLGGFDPYAASKASADIMSQAYANLLAGKAKFNIARGGNVIGGGDIAPNRLVPDMERAIASGSAVSIRNPNQTRPWQHVLDCLDGYLKILEGPQKPQVAWNVGPTNTEPSIKVIDFVNLYLKSRHRRAQVNLVADQHHESEYLELDVEKLEMEHNWKALLATEDSIKMTAEWFNQVDLGEDPRDVTVRQIKSYLSLR
jgi:CDP-glucose 4,6-dehydratase